MSKRAAPEKSSNGSNDSQKRQRKSRYFKKFRDNDATLKDGISGLFISCVRGKESRATDEATDLICNAIEVLYGAPESSVEKKEDTDSIEATIAKELGSLKAEKETRSFSFIRTQMDCSKYFPNHTIYTFLSLTAQRVLVISNSILFQQYIHIDIFY